MSVFIRSLLNTSQTLDSVALPAFALQERGNATAALIAAAAAKTINLWSGMADTPETRSFEEYVPVTTDVISLPDYAEDVSIIPAGAIAALTINMPLNPRDKQRVTLVFDQSVTTLTQQIASDSGHILKGALAAATAKGFGTWMFRKKGKIWYRVG